MKLGLAGAGRIGAMHTAHLAAIPGVDAVIVADVDRGRATDVAERAGAHVHAARGVDELFDLGLDGLVVAAATSSHAGLVLRALASRLPVFCEKPVATDVAGTVAVVAESERTGGFVQVGFQRRFDAGHVAARGAVRDGRLGFLHTVRCTTLDPAPPPPAYVAASGGIFRDCSVHDFDAVRWVTGRDVVEVYARGANRGAEFFREAGDVDTGMALLTLDDGTLVVVSTTRYNAAGYDVRMELLGERGSIAVGLDDTTPLRSAEGGVGWPEGPPAATFVERFRPAYVAELRAFVDVLGGAAVPPGVCTPAEALEASYVAEACEASRRSGQPVRVGELRV